MYLSLFYVNDPCWYCIHVKNVQFSCGNSDYELCGVAWTLALHNSRIPKFIMSSLELRSMHLHFSLFMNMQVLFYIHDLGHISCLKVVHHFILINKLMVTWFENIFWRNLCTMACPTTQLWWRKVSESEGDTVSCVLSYHSTQSSTMMYRAWPGVRGPGLWWACLQ